MRARTQGAQCVVGVLILQHSRRCPRPGRVASRPQTWVCAASWRSRASAEEFNRSGSSLEQPLAWTFPSGASLRDCRYQPTNSPAPAVTGSTGRPRCSRSTSCATQTSVQGQGTLLALGSRARCVIMNRSRADLNEFFGTGSIVSRACGLLSCSTASHRPKRRRPWMRADCGYRRASHMAMAIPLTNATT